MIDEIPKQYNPRETEDKWYKFWEENNFFSAKVNPAKKPYTIVIPPPNVTGILHMGHALNNTIQDILIRYHRMKGFETLWMPGTDHAGIATQNVVEKAIAREGLKRQDLGREKFIERVWSWKEQYGSTIIRQLKKLGASCDWKRERFTMDEEYSRAVRNAFVSLWSKKPKGLIYQDDKIINWCPRCQTALSDEEAPHRELKGSLYYLRYPLRGQSHSGTVPEYIVVATTRPETMLGDTAVAVNPRDRRYKKLVGKTLLLPLVSREIKIIADSMVDMKFGTGAVKVTPAHDPNDYSLGKKHRLESVNVMYPDARMNENAGDYKDMDRFEAREVILEDLKEKGLLEKIEPHALSAGHCYRCHTIIEPYLSKQWFVRMKPLAKPAIEAVKKGKIKFHPSRWTKVYLNWMENIQDWCISRQIWWGHRIPIWYCRDCRNVAMASVETPEKCAKCGSANIKQDEDVLDTWFSSWLWPFATFYWPDESRAKPDLKYFYPTSTLVTAPEIIFFWVARMIMAGYEFMADMPFTDVYIHGTVRDIEGKKMSKSLGNIIDPLEIINEYGADALRFSLISITAQGQDVLLSKVKFVQGRIFANKIWNASRFILMNLDRSVIKSDLCVLFKKEDLSLVNRWILSRFYSTLKTVEKDIENYRFNEAANTLYGFFWHEFCDWYLEIIKPDIKNLHNQVVMYKILEKFLRTSHPFMPFISEEIWQKIRGQSPAGTVPGEESIMIQPWPHMQEGIIDHKSENAMQEAVELVTHIRNMRLELDIPVGDNIEVRISVPNKAKRAVLEALRVQIKNLARLSKLEILGEYSRGRGEFTSVLKEAHITIMLAGAVEAEKHRDKISGRIHKIEEEIKTKEKMLSDKNFATRAPRDIVDKEREKLKNLKDEAQKLKGVKDGLG